MDQNLEIQQEYRHELLYCRRVLLIEHFKKIFLYYKLCYFNTVLSYKHLLVCGYFEARFFGKFVSTLKLQNTSVVVRVTQIPGLMS